MGNEKLGKAVSCCNSAKLGEHAPDCPLGRAWGYMSQIPATGVDVFLADGQHFIVKAYEPLRADRAILNQGRRVLCRLRTFVFVDNRDEIRPRTHSWPVYLEDGYESEAADVRMREHFLDAGLWREVQ